MLYYSDEKDILNLNDKDITVLIPVNTVGIMGAGLAKQFADKYPDMVSVYKDCCDDGSLGIGHCILEDSIYGKFIFFPTKEDWRDASSLEYIEQGLDSLLKCLDYFEDIKIAIPPLGCGLGGLEKGIVLNLIYEKTKEYKNDMFLVGW